MAKAKKPVADKATSADSKPTEGGASKSTAAPKSGTPKTPAKPKTTPAKAATSSTSSATSASKGNDAKPTAPKTPDTSSVKKLDTDAKPATAKAQSTAAKSPNAEPAPTVPASKTSTAPATQPQPAQQERRGGFLPLFLGGIVAAALGFFAAQNDLFSAPDTTGETVADNSARIETLEQAEVDLSAVDALQTQVDDVSTTLADINALIAALDARVAKVEDRPAPDGGPSIAEQTAFEQELQALKDDAEAQRAEVARLLANAQSVEEATAAAAQAAAIQSAVSQITSALVTGEPFADTLTTLQEADVDVPEALSAVADEGVTTIDSLQERYPDSARAALGSARTSGAMEGESGLGGFLKRQLGARSTQPRDGADPDAILSRAEAQVRAGTVNEALSELDALPAPVQAAMQDWLDDARARAAAAQATQDLSQSLTAN